MAADSDSGRQPSDNEKDLAAKELNGNQHNEKVLADRESDENGFNEKGHTADLKHDIEDALAHDRLPPDPDAHLSEEERAAIVSLWSRGMLRTICS
jgi:hypothetical protein